jgi:hypothetical protein
MFQESNAVRGLAVDDVRRLSDCGAQDDADQREAERELVADDLRAEERSEPSSEYLLFDDQPESAMP